MEGFFLLEIVISILLITSTALLIAQYQHKIYMLETQSKQYLQALSLAIHIGETNKIPDDIDDHNHAYIIETKESPIFIAELPLDKPYIIRTINVKWTDYTQQTRVITVKTGAFPKNNELLHES